MGGGAGGAQDCKLVCGINVMAEMQLLITLFFCIWPDAYLSYHHWPLQWPLWMPNCQPELCQKNRTNTQIVYYLTQNHKHKFDHPHSICCYFKDFVLFVPVLRIWLCGCAVHILTRLSQLTDYSNAVAFGYNELWQRYNELWQGHDELWRGHNELWQCRNEM